MEELKGTPIEIEHAKIRLAEEIRDNLHRLRDGHFSPDEIAFTQVTKDVNTRELPGFPSDEALDDFGPETWDKYAEEHPDAIQAMESRDRLDDVCRVLEHQQMVQPYLEAGHEEAEAIRLCIEDHPEEVNFEIIYWRSSLEAAQKAGFVMPEDFYGTGI